MRGDQRQRSMFTTVETGDTDPRMTVESKSHANWCWCHTGEKVKTSFESIGRISVKVQTSNVVIWYYLVIRWKIEMGHALTMRSRSRICGIIFSFFLQLNLYGLNVQDKWTAVWYLGDSGKREWKFINMIWYSFWRRNSDFIICYTKVLKLQERERK